MSAFDGLKARLERLFAESPGERGGALRDAVIEMRTGLGVMRDALARTEQELASERTQHEDAVRRRELAAGIGDQETVDVAGRFAARHQARTEMLERKLAVQRDELALAERELDEMMTQYGAAARGRSTDTPESIERAWRDIAAAGGSRPGVDLDAELEQAAEKRRLHEAAVEAQLAHLKRKLGKQP
ncbi:MAG TPA: hypothetical protein VFL88_11825 [Gemmatimonadales bacterium]|nr:hypothetical protein [Gemmatimonadales bacterium]